jgi:hypothetical protein
MLSVAIYTAGCKQNMNKTDSLIFKHGSSEADEILQLYLVQHNHQTFHKKEKIYQSFNPV